MKRKNNLYENLYKMENIVEAFNEVCRNTKNKRKVKNYKQYKCIYISRIYETLKNEDYKFIKETLKIKYYVRYQDDFLLFHESKQYIKYCFEEIKNFLEKENLQLNRKSRIYKNTNNFIFLGRDKNGRYSKYRDVKRRLKKKKFLYNQKDLELSSLAISIINYEHLLRKEISI